MRKKFLSLQKFVTEKRVGCIEESDAIVCDDNPFVSQGVFELNAINQYTVNLAVNYI